MAADFPRFYGIPLSVIRDAVTLWEFAAMAANLPRESATWRALNGSDRAEWDLQAQLLARGVSALEWMQWAKSRDGERNRNRPTPIVPPWIEDEGRETRHFGGDPLPLNELVDFLGWESELAT